MGSMSRVIFWIPDGVGTSFSGTSGMPSSVPCVPIPVCLAWRGRLPHVASAPESLDNSSIDHATT